MFSSSSAWTSGSESSWGSVDWLAIGTVIVLVYFAGLDALFGATLGKASLGLRVVGPDGGPPTLRQALVREAFTVVGSAPFHRRSARARRVDLDWSVDSAK